MHVEPFGGGFLAAADLVAHDRIENLAPPPVIEPSPASRRISSVSRIGILKTRWAKCGLDGGECLYMQLRIERSSLFKRSRYHLFSRSGCNPPNHVHLGNAEAEAHPSRPERFRQLRIRMRGASRFLAANAQNWQDKMQMFE
jgi:hypothetical protein